MKLVPALLVCLGLLAGAVPVGAEPPGFKLIVNARVSTPPLAVKEVARIFMKKSSTWPSGLRITPVDLTVDSPTREAFSRAVHGRGAEPVERRWQTLIFSGMGVPPVQMQSEDDVLSFVKNNVGAIGYVGSGTPLPSEVRELEVET